MTKVLFPTAFPDDRERDVRKHLKARLKVLGGELRKMSWFPRSGAPDEMVLLPGRHFLAELKRPTTDLEEHQVREIRKLEASGVLVYVLHTREEVDQALFWRGY